MNDLRHLQKKSTFVTFQKLPHLICYLLPRCFHEPQAQSTKPSGLNATMGPVSSLSCGHLRFPVPPPPTQSYQNAKLPEMFSCVNFALLWWKTKANFCLLPSLHFLDCMINSDSVIAEDDDELSDEEEEMDATDGEQMEKEAAAHDLESGDHSFLTSILESFMEKVSFLKSREGRAGLIHNFLRGLQLMTAPVPKG